MLRVNQLSRLKKIILKLSLIEVFKSIKIDQTPQFDYKYTNDII